MSLSRIVTPLLGWTERLYPVSLMVVQPHHAGSWIKKHSGGLCSTICLSLPVTLSLPVNGGEVELPAHFSLACASAFLRGCGGGEAQCTGAGEEDWQIHLGEGECKWIQHKDDDETTVNSIISSSANDNISKSNITITDIYRFLNASLITQTQISIIWFWDRSAAEDSYLDLVIT